MNRPCLIAIGGHLGTGKTTLAYNLRRHLPAFSQAVILDDDHIRRELLGAELSRKLQPEDYSPEISRQVRHITRVRTEQALGNGLHVINPTGFFNPNQRATVEEWAQTYGATFIGLWLAASRAIMEARITKRLLERDILPELRLEEGHASDADIGVIDKFGAIDAPQSALWHIINSSVSKAEVLELARKFLEGTHRI